MPARDANSYLDALRDNRELWVDGTRCPDITQHPSLRRPAETIAALYQLQHDFEHRDYMTYVSPSSGDRVGRSFEAPRSRDAFRARMRMMARWADETGGLMGRSPDFLNTMLMVFASRAEILSSLNPLLSKRIHAYYEYARENDLCLTHGLVNPRSDHTRGDSDQDNGGLALRKVGETDAGIIVRGGRSLATLAPFANELFVFPRFPLREGNDALALMFAIPVASPGLRIICRESFEPRSRGAFDHPLGHLDEMDCLLIFDDVVVPHDRVFIDADLALYREVDRLLASAPHPWLQSAIRASAKTEVVLGVLVSMADALGTSTIPHIQQKLGEIVSYLEMIKAGIAAAEAGARPGPGGVLEPAPEPLRCLNTLFPMWFQRMVELIRVIGGGGLMMIPTEATLNSEIGPLIEKFHQGGAWAGRERIALFRLAWDLAGEALGSRQALYELFFSGDPLKNLAARGSSYDYASCKDRVRRLLTTKTAPRGCPTKGEQHDDER